MIQCSVQRIAPAPLLRKLLLSTFFLLALCFIPLCLMPNHAVKQASAQSQVDEPIVQFQRQVETLATQHGLEQETVTSMLHAGIAPDSINPQSGAEFAAEMARESQNAAGLHAANVAATQANAPVALFGADLRDCSSQNFPRIFLNVAVDDNGTPVTDLDASNFACFENNELQTDNFVVTPPQTGGGVRLADIVFLIDNSGSMSDEIADVRNNVNAFAQALTEGSIDFRLGLVGFGSDRNPFVYNSGILFDSAEVPVFQDLIGNLGTGGGTEPGYLAVRRAIEQFNFRSGAQKIFVIITDEDSDGAVSGGTISAEEKQTVINLLLANGVTVHSAVDCGSNSSNDHYCDDSSIRGVTGGLQFNVVGPYDGILDTIVSETAGTYVLRYISSNPVEDATTRNIRCDINTPTLQESVGCTYIPGAAPQIQLTQETLSLNRTPQSEGSSVTIQAQVTDAAEPFVQAVTLFYRNSSSDEPYIELAMTSSGADIYEATIPNIAQPGVEYYVRATDGQVASQLPSEDLTDNLFNISVLPNVAPVINHTPVAMVPINMDISIDASVVDTTNLVDSVVLRWRPRGELIYRTIPMLTSGGNLYSATILAADVEGDVEYFIRAADDFDVASTVGTVDEPLTIRVLSGSPELGATTECTLKTDADENGMNSSGDTLQCVVTITNSGDAMAMAVRYQTALDDYASLVSGSVVLSQGVLIEGNGDGDLDIEANLGNIAVNGSATVIYDLLLSDDLGEATGFDVPDYVDCTDHPTVSPDNPSGTPDVIIGQRPVIETEKSVELLVDVDRNGVAGPGDTLEYTAIMRNRGNQAAPASTFVDSLDPNTDLVVGSVETTAGTIRSGNSDGDTTVNIDMGEMAPNAEVTVRFQVEIPRSLSDTILNISNLAACIYPQAPPVCVGRPSQNAICRPVIEPMRPTPLLDTSKQVVLFNDADDSGGASEGDTLLYQIAIENQGNRAATDVIMTDELNPATTVVPGTVRTTDGIVIGGNRDGDTVIGVSIGEIMPDEVVQISFESTINESAPTNGLLENVCTVQSAELPEINVPDSGIYIGFRDPNDPVDAASTPPSLIVSESVMLIEDEGLEGGSEGDTLLYLITVQNNDSVAAANLLFENELQSNVQLVPGTLQSNMGTLTVIDPPAGNPAAGQTLQIALDEMLPGTTWNIGFQSEILTSDVPAIINQAEVSYDDTEGGRITLISNEQSSLFPGVVQGTVESVGTIFPIFSGLYLPIMDGANSCITQGSGSIDLVLVLDNSSSMSSGGKLVAATSAASGFLDQMNFSRDQAAIASFSATSVLEQPLSQDQVALDSTLATIEAKQGTAIGEGISVAVAELQSSRRIASNAPIIILFSDGQNSVGQDPIPVAQSAKDAGIRIYTIGLGNDVDSTTMRQIASTPNNYRAAPTIADLPGIYAQIANEVRCE